MVLGNKGQALIAGIMVAVIVFIIAVQFITPLKEIVNDVRASDSLDCGNTTISTGQKATCVIVDWYMPYLIVMIMAGGLGFITGDKFAR
jgi:hypothetical protein